MNNLQLRHLKLFCAKHEIDIAEIDECITYSENKDHLKTLVPKNLEDLLEEGESQLEEYMANHFLTYYAACILEGATVSKVVGAPIQSTRFSLKQLAKL